MSLQSSISARKAKTRANGGMQSGGVPGRGLSMNAVMRRQGFGTLASPGALVGHCGGSSGPDSCIERHSSFQVEAKFPTLGPSRPRIPGSAASTHLGWAHPWRLNTCTRTFMLKLRYQLLCLPPWIMGWSQLQSRSQNSIQKRLPENIAVSSKAKFLLMT